MDFSTLDNDALDALRIDVLTEIERRSALDHIPEQVRALADAYEAGGGNRADLAEALT